MKGQTIQKEENKVRYNKGETSTNLTKIAHNWEEVIKTYNCFFCQKNFTEEDIQKKNYQLTYATIYGTAEIYHIYHQQHKGSYSNFNEKICSK